MASASSKLAHQLHEFTPASLAATTAAWEHQLKAHRKELQPSEWQRVLDWTSKHINYEEGEANTYSYGIFPSTGDNVDEAEAIVDLVYAKEGRKWLKLLQLQLCPNMDLSVNTENLDFKRLTSIYSAAVVGTILLTGTNHPTKVTKLYGRTGTLLAFLTGLGTYIETSFQIEGLKVTLEGRWLVFKTR